MSGGGWEKGDQEFSTSRTTPLTSNHVAPIHSLYPSLLIPPLSSLHHIPTLLSLPLLSLFSHSNPSLLSSSSPLTFLSLYFTPFTLLLFSPLTLLPPSVISPSLLLLVLPLCPHLHSSHPINHPPIPFLFSLLPCPSYPSLYLANLLFHLAYLHPSPQPLSIHHSPYPTPPSSHFCYSTPTLISWSSSLSTLIFQSPYSFSLHPFPPPSTSLSFSPTTHFSVSSPCPLCQCPSPPNPHLSTFFLPTLHLAYLPHSSSLHLASLSLSTPLILTSSLSLIYFCLKLTFATYYCVSTQINLHF